MQAENIDDVLRILDGIIAACKAARDPLGYFPALYRQVTLEVKKGIDQGFFDDGPRMDRFDALFASRYFEAYETFRSGGTPSKAWQVALRETVKIIRSLESRNVPAIIDALNSIVRMDEPALLATVDPARVQP